MSDLGKRIGEFRRTYLPDVGPFGGGVPTGAAYGCATRPIWQTYADLDLDLEAAMNRASYEPVDAFEVSWSKDTQMFVAARYWIGRNGIGVKDLTTFSSGLPDDLAYLSGSEPGSGLAQNPRWRHIKNPDPRLRADYGYYERKPGSWWMTGHHFDPTAPSTSAAPELRNETIAALGRLRLKQK